MSTRWRIRCPYCNREIAYGYGYPHTPKVGVSMLRCKYCGQLMFTESKEYLNMTVTERLKLKNNKQMMNDISQSLKRTNHEEYRSILIEQGCQFYPITDVDEQRFEGITHLSECQPTYETTKALYDFGILIEEEIKDAKTGGIKQEILDDRQKQYGRIGKITLWSTLVGFVVFIIFGVIFSSANLGELSIALAFLPTIAAVVAFSLGMDRYYKIKNPTIAENQKAQKQKRERNAKTCKTLLQTCGMRFFIKYYQQIKTLPIRDVVVSETYSPEERDERLTAAKKIIDLNLTTIALKTIVEKYGGSLESEETEQAKKLLADIPSEPSPAPEDDEPSDEKQKELYDPYDE